MNKFIIDNTEDRAEILLQHLSITTDDYKRSIDNVESIIQLLKNKGVTLLLVHKNNEKAAELIQSLPESIWTIVYSGGGISESYSKSHIAAYKGVFDTQHKDEFLKIVDTVIQTLDKAENKEKKIQEFKKLFGHDPILESKLNFLHHCLTPDGLKEEEVTKSEWAKMEEFAKLTEANDGPFGDKYLLALRTLRDKLLAS